MEYLTGGFRHMRNISLIGLTMAASLTCFAATSIEATYAVGDLDGLSAGAKGTVRVEDSALVFHSGKVTVEAPYTKITATEWGQKVTHSNDAYKHKFWEVNKMFGNKTERQSLIINFKDASGKDQTMTLELTEGAAYDVRNIVDARSGITARRQSAEAWWGDDIWKTDRNQKSWNTQ